LSDALNIAVVGACPYPVPQGSQVYLRNTALAYRHAGHAPRLVTYGYGIGEDASGLPLHRAANPPGARKTAAGPSWAKPVQDLLLTRTLRRVVREHRIDIVNAHNYEALVVALAARARPILYHAHNALADELPYYFPGRQQSAAVGRSLDRRLPRRADRIVAPHARLAEYLVSSGCDPARVHVVPPGIDAEAFDAERPARESASVVYAGNLDEYQNLGLLDRAMDRVLAQAPETELVVATLDSRKEATGRVCKRARFVRTRSLAELSRGMQRDLVFACPRVSWSGYPIKLLNAMAAGLAIVCCENSAHPLTHGHNALVVPDNNEAEFAQAILRLLREPELRHSLGTNARMTAQKRHTIEAVAAQMDGVLALMK
jgi:glycosyltransferase involved in cell wall biosynthesis